MAQRKLSTLKLKSLLSGDVWATVKLGPDGKVTLEGKDDDLDDLRVIGGRHGQLRPSDGLKYMLALKKMFARSSTTAVIETPEEEAAATKFHEATRSK